MNRWRGAWLLVGALMGLTHAAGAQRADGTVLRSVQIEVEGGLTLVTIDADGTLPLPTAHPLEGPWRIYFDLPGVTPRTRGTTEVPGAGVISRARFALNSSSPPVTRVVLDLMRPESVRVNADRRQVGRLRVLVGSESGPTGPAPAPAAGRMSAPTVLAANPAPTSDVPPATTRLPSPAAPSRSVPTAGAVALSGAVAPVASPLAPPPAPARRRPRSAQASTGPPLPAREVERYREQLSGVLERIEARRSVITAIDADETMSIDVLRSEAADLGDLRRILEAVTPSSVMRSTHDLLIASCTFGAMAASLRVDAVGDNSLDARRKASAAAAGSLMLFEQACANLGCTGTPR